MTARCTIGALTFIATPGTYTSSVLIVDESRRFENSTVAQVVLSNEQFQSLELVAASLSRADRRAMEADAEIARLTRERDAAVAALWTIANADGNPEQRAAACQNEAREFVGWRPF